MLDGTFLVFVRFSTGVNFINVLRARFSYEILAPKLQSCVLGLKLEKTAENDFRTKNVRVKH